MRLVDLDASFIRVVEYADSGDVKVYERIDSLEGAQGVSFQCPKCAEGKECGSEIVDGRERRFVRGAHSIICWFRNPRGAPPVSPAVRPGPGRWWAEGSGLDDLTFGHGDPPTARSVQLHGGCSWHGNVTNGDAA